MHIENVMKVGDINHTEIDQGAINFLHMHCAPTWKDQMLKEDIYNIPSIMEVIEQNDGCQEWDGTRPTPGTKKELKKINRLLKEADCSYLRITF